MLDRRDGVHVFYDALEYDRLGLRHGRMEGDEISGSTVAVLRFVERGHVDAAHGQQATQEAAATAGTAFPLPGDEGICHLAHDLFALADDEEIEEVSDRLDIVDAGAATDDERHVFAALACPERDTGEIEHVEDVRIDHLVLQRESEQIASRELGMRLERVERHMALAHGFGHVRPGRIGALDRRVGALVQYIVEYGEAQVAHADLVDIRQSQGPEAVDRSMVFHRLVPFTACVAGRLQYRLQYLVIELYHQISSVSNNPTQ